MAVATIVVIFIWLKVVRGQEDPMSSFSTFIAKKGPLIISVLESGTIEEHLLSALFRTAV
jgi:hypothetical protein